MQKLKSVIKSDIFLLLLVLVALLFCSQDVWAAEGGSVFEKVRDKAASSLKDIKRVVYILAGFGLIGFAFLAIFNKIKWAWFANIAISLFLLSVMGLFIDDFTGTNKHASMLDYGNYLSGDGGIAGTDNTIGTNTTPENDEITPNKNEETNKTPDPCYDANNKEFDKDRCKNLRLAMSESTKRCTKYGGIWDGSNCYKNGQTLNEKELYGSTSVSGSSQNGGADQNYGGSSNQNNNSNSSNSNQKNGNNNGGNSTANNNNGDIWGDNLQPVWNPETQSYELPEVVVVGNASADRKPTPGISAEGSLPNADDLNKDLQNIVNNIPGSAPAADGKKENGNILDDWWNRGKEKAEKETKKAIDDAKKKAEEEAKRALDKAKQDAVNAAKNKVNDVVGNVGVLDQLGVDETINRGIDDMSGRIDTGKIVNDTKSTLGWGEEETSERRGEDSIGAPLDSGKIPDVGGSPNASDLNKDLQDIVNNQNRGEGNSSNYGWNEETSERGRYDSENQYSGSGWGSEETGERNGYDSAAAQSDNVNLQPVWNPETQSYELPEVVVVGNASASRKPTTGVSAEGSLPNVNDLNKDLQNIVNGSAGGSSGYGWNEETTERNGYNSDGTPAGGANSDYGWGEETTEGRGWGG